MSNLQIDGETDELRHGPCEGSSLSSSGSKAKIRTGRFTPIPNLFWKHHALIREAHHCVKVLARAKSISPRQFVFTSFAAEQGP